MSSLLITCRNKSAVERHYLPALRLGGWLGEVRLVTPGTPLPPWEEVAGLLMTGGEDIHPRWWDGQEALHPEAVPDEERTELEVPAAREAWARGLPILGICRGEQLLNVALGGSLIQDIPSLPGDQGPHQVGTSDLPQPAHGVIVAPGSRLAELLGGTAATVNSRHHQAVLRVAPGLRAVAWHQGPQGPGLVEAVEAVDPARWVVGVQWHPENLVGQTGNLGEAALGIFRGFARVLGEPRESPR